MTMREAIDKATELAGEKPTAGQTRRRRPSEILQKEWQE
jgi:hypothetical protein